MVGSQQNGALRGRFPGNDGGGSFRGIRHDKVMRRVVFYDYCALEFVHDNMRDFSEGFGTLIGDNIWSSLSKFTQSPHQLGPRRRTLLFDSTSYVLMFWDWSATQEEYCI